MKLTPSYGVVTEAEVPLDMAMGLGAFAMEDDANFTRRMRELVDDGCLVFDKFDRWRVTEKGLACLLASADRAAKTNAQERT
jgi:hypothetical protein